MTTIGLLSDTHHYLDDKIFKHFDNCNEIWHAGDFGTIGLANKLSAFRPLKGVYGNIDGNDVRSVFGESLYWSCENVNARPRARPLSLHAGTPACSRIETEQEAETRK